MIYDKWIYLIGAVVWYGLLAMIALDIITGLIDRVIKIREVIKDYREFKKSLKR
mgnify:CR=1 FL=1